MSEIIYENESYKIIGACIGVHKELGCGFLEAVYQESLELEFKNNNIPYEREKELKIFFKNVELSKKYIADFICFNKIIVEIKALSKLNPEHDSQILNYLKTTGIKLGILINFGEKSLKYKRLLL
jgi:GxxExxY protein